MLPFFQCLESLKFGAGNEYTVASINVTHLLCLVVFIGAVLVVDLRLLGTGMRRQPLSDVVRSAQPWLLGGFAGDVRDRLAAGRRHADEGLLQRSVLAEDGAPDRGDHPDLLRAGRSPHSATKLPRG